MRALLLHQLQLEKYTQKNMLYLLRSKFRASCNFTLDTFLTTIQKKNLYFYAYTAQL